MYLVAIGWIYVVLMMAVAEAVSSQGTVLGAVITFVFYGVVPVSIIVYIMGTPSRKRARQKAEMAQMAETAEMANTAEAAGTDEAPDREAAAAAVPADGSAPAPDGGGQAPGGAVAPEREKV